MEITTSRLAIISHASGGASSAPAVKSFCESSLLQSEIARSAQGGFFEIVKIREAIAGFLIRDYTSLYDSKLFLTALLSEFESGTAYISNQTYSLSSNLFVIMKNEMEPIAYVVSGLEVKKIIERFFTSALEHGFLTEAEKLTKEKMLFTHEEFLEAQRTFSKMDQDILEQYVKQRVSSELDFPTIEELDITNFVAKNVKKEGLKSQFFSRFAGSGYDEAKMNFIMYSKYNPLDFFYFDDDKREVLSYQSLQVVSSLDKCKGFLPLKNSNWTGTYFFEIPAVISETFHASIQKMPPRIMRQVTSIGASFDTARDISYLHNAIDLSRLEKMNALIRASIFFQLNLDGDMRELEKYLPKELAHKIEAFNPFLDSYNPLIQIRSYAPLNFLIPLLSDLDQEFIQKSLNPPTDFSRNLEFKELRKKIWRLEAHGIEETKGGIANLANLILEGKLRSTIHLGPIGDGEMVNPAWFSGEHGPYLVFSEIGYEHVAYLIKNELERNFLHRVIDLSVTQNLLSIEEAIISKRRILTFEDVRGIEEKHFETAETLAAFIETRT